MGTLRIRNRKEAKKTAITTICFPPITIRKSSAFICVHRSTERSRSLRFKKDHHGKTVASYSATRNSKFKIQNSFRGYD